MILSLTLIATKSYFRFRRAHLGLLGSARLTTRTPSVQSKFKLSILLLGLFTSLTVLAKDFGIDGHTFPIVEEDILKVIEKRLASIDIDKVNRDMQEKTKNYVERPTEAPGITKAKESKVLYYDPSYILNEDIRDHMHNLIYASGTKINPLEHVPLREGLAFIDGDDQAQVKLALKIRKQKNGKLKIILVKGSPLKIQREHKIWIYFDQAGFITSKLSIKEVPAFVEQDGLRLKINIIGEDKKGEKHE